MAHGIAADPPALEPADNGIVDRVEPIEPLDLREREDDARLDLFGGRGLPSRAGDFRLSGDDEAGRST